MVSINDAILYSCGKDLAKVLDSTAGPVILIVQLEGTFGQEDLDGERFNAITVNGFLDPGAGDGRPNKGDQGPISVRDRRLKGMIP